MNAYLAYSYSTGFTKKEQKEIDFKIKNARKELGKGFSVGTTLQFRGIFNSCILAPGEAKPDTNCAKAFQSQDFYIGLALGGLLVIGSILLNRPLVFNLYQNLENSTN